MENFSDDMITTQASENLYSLYNLLAKKLKLPTGNLSGCSYVRSAPSPWPDFNFGITKNFPASAHEIENLPKNKELSPYLIINSVEHSAEIAATLNTLGFKPVIRWPAMALEVASFNETSSETVNLKQVETEVELIHWFKLASINLFGGKPFSLKYAKLCNTENLYFFTIEYNLNAAGTILLYKTGDIAGIYMVSVSENFRGKGIASLALNQVIVFCRKNNIPRITLQANAKSEPLYQKLGFRVNGNFDIYWKVGKF